MKVLQRPLARFDLIEEADFLEQAYNLDRARKFLFAANETFQQLAAMPLMGSPRPDLALEIPEMRHWRIKGFTEYLIFYRPADGGGVEIIRVLHAKRNLPEILADEEAQ